jgi:cell division protein FtsB
MESIFKINIKEAIKSPYTYILIVAIFAIYSIFNILIATKNEEIQRTITELQKCNVELERRNKILEEIVFNQKINKDAE